MSAPLNDRDRWLAAEYALGVLEGADMAEAERRYTTEAAFRDATDDWTMQLTPLLDEVDPVAPPPAALDAIEARLFPGTAPRPSGIWQSLAFWRGLGLAATGVAAAAVALLLLPPGEAPLPPAPLVATLTSSGDLPPFLARFDPAQGTMTVRVAYSDTEARVPELWVVPADGVPRSLGVLAGAVPTQVEIGEEARAFLASGATLAVSLEPEGGSPTGAPTGPVVASGILEAL